MLFAIRHPGTVPLETKRLTLRRLTPDDAPSMYANWASDPEVYRFMTTSRMVDLPDVMRFIDNKLEAYQSGDFYYWGVFPKGEASCIGMATLTEVLPAARTANLAYSLGKNWWGKGYAHEAAEAVLTFAFDEVGFKKIYGCHFVGNERSGDVLRACGMEYQGRSKTTVYHHGEYLRFDSYEITSRQYAFHRVRKK